MAVATIETISDGPRTIKLTPIAPLEPAVVVPLRRRTPGGRVLFVAVVVIPTLLAAAYYAFFAADIYTSEARFQVRSPQRHVSGLLSGFLQSTGFVRAQDDNHAVIEFITSRSAVAALNENRALEDMLSRPEADLLTRYPPFWASPTQESLFRHYLRFITVKNDNVSGVTTLQVRGFRPDDARAAANRLLDLAERLINRLNDRAREDAVNFSQVEVANAEGRLLDVQRRVTEFRNRESLIDPDKQSAAILGLIMKLAVDVAEKRARIREIERQSPQSPQIPALQANVEALQQQIDSERAQVVGDAGSIAPRIAAYEQLLLEREIATQMLTSATTSLENARIDAHRQQLYLEKIVEPGVPDRATHPKAVGSVLWILMVTLAAYGTICLLLSHFYEHERQ